jgi:plastocyanin
MKSIKHLRKIIYLAVFAMIGCHPSPKLVYTAPPWVQFFYVDGGGTIQWEPRGGRPFKIVWVDGNPCKPSDNLTSDGKSIVTCTAENGGTLGGSYRYYVDESAQHMKAAKGPTSILNMHVGSCTSCGGLVLFPKSQHAALSKANTGANPLSGTNPVAISCPDAIQTKIDPSTVSGLKVGDTVYFEHYGQLIQPMTLTFTPACQKYQNSGDSASCQISQVPTTYTAISDGCKSASGTLVAQ